jgi:hypothetical protein
MPGAFGILASSLIRHSDFVIPAIRAIRVIRGLFRTLFNAVKARGAHGALPTRRGRRVYIRRPRRRSDALPKGNL